MRIVDEAVMAENHARARAARVADGGRMPVEPENVSFLFELNGIAYFDFGGVPIKMPPTPATLGAEISALKVRITRNRMDAQSRELSDAELLAYRVAVEDAKRLVADGIRPVRWRDRIAHRLGRWKLLDNATARELGILIDFLVQRQQVSRIRM